MVAIDFPASPTIGQIFVAAGISYVWNGYGWLVKPSDLSGGGSGFVQLTGDTMVGDLVIDKVDPTLWLDKSVSGEIAAVTGLMNNVRRWRLILGDTTAEGGVAAGSHFRLEAYDNAGVLIGSPLVIDRATGLLLLAGNPTAALGAATKQYVDALSNVQIASQSEVNVGADNTKAVSPNTLKRSHVAFHATRGGSPQLVGLNAITAVIGFSELLDTDGNFNGVSFRPNVAGWYEIGGQISMPSVGNDYLIFGISQNGVALPHYTQIQARDGAQTVQMQVKGMLHFNGSTDYVELVGSCDYFPSPQFNYAVFWGHRVFPT